MMDQYVACLHNYQPGHNKLYVVRVDRIDSDTFAVVGSYGKATATTLIDQQKGKFRSLGTAMAHACSLVEEKRRGGYAVMSVSPIFTAYYPYAGGMKVEAVLKKIDCSRIFDRTKKKQASPEVVNDPVEKACDHPHSRKHTPPTQPATTRATRDINI